MLASTFRTAVGMGLGATLLAASLLAHAPAGGGACIVWFGYHSPCAVALAVPPGASAVAIVETGFFNHGAGTWNGAIQPSATPSCTGDTPDWLSVSPTGFLIPPRSAMGEMLAITANAASLAVGRYTGYVCIDAESDWPVGLPIPIPVRLRVSEAFFVSGFEVGEP